MFAFPARKPPPLTRAGFGVDGGSSRAHYVLGRGTVPRSIASHGSDRFFGRVRHSPPTAATSWGGGVWLACTSWHLGPHARGGVSRVGDGLRGEAASQRPVGSHSKALLLGVLLVCVCRFFHWMQTCGLAPSLSANACSQPGLSARPPGTSSLCRVRRAVVRCGDGRPRTSRADRYVTF